MKLDNNVPNLANGDTVSETGLNKLALEIMNINDSTETVDVPEPTEVIEPEQVTSIFNHTVESVPLYTMHDDGTFHEVKSFHGVNRKPKNPWDFQKARLFNEIAPFFMHYSILNA